MKKVQLPAIEESDLSSQQSESNHITNFVVKSRFPSLKTPPVEDINQRLPEEWIHQRVNKQYDNDSNSNNQGVQLSKVEWENQIAKHILSLFASSQVLEKYGESKALLDFVDCESEGVETKEQASNESVNPTAVVTSKYRVPKKRKPKKAREIDLIRKNAQTNSHQSDIDFIKQIQKKILKEEEEEDDDYGNKYRTNTVIKSKTGEDIIVRGQPRCYPIWFVSSGEVYSDWSGLPGGKKLQAQLNNLYEKRLYSEYLGVIERLLTGLFREQLYGESSKDLSEAPQFGISALYSPLSKSAPALKSKRPTADNKNSKGLPSDEANFGTVLSWTADGQVHLPEPSKPSAPSTTIRKLPAQDGFLHSDSQGHSQLLLPALQTHWSLLVATANAMGILCVERKHFELAMSLLKRAESWANHSEFLPDRAARKELRAHVSEAVAYFFFRKGKALAAISYSSAALESYEVSGNIDGVAGCLLHLAAAKSLLGQHKAAHKQLFEFLAMVQSGRLAQSQSTPKQLCLVAIGYHNLAVVQLKLQLPDLACKNSQNARRLARLCLSYSNRYIHVFQYTHEIAIADIKWELARKRAEELTAEQLQFIKDLSESLFAPSAEVETGEG